MSKRAPRQPPPAPGALLSRSSCYISRTARSPIRTKLDRTVKPAIEMSVLGRFLGQEGEGVGQHVEDGLQALERPGLRARRVEDDAAPDRAGEASGEPALGAHEAHPLSQAGRLAVEDGAAALRGQV